MEALAIECYAEIQGQRPLAAYSSVFNLAWYSLKPLALGQPDTRRAPTLAVSPSRQNSIRAPVPRLPATIGPVCNPTRRPPTGRPPAGDPDWRCWAAGSLRAER